VYLVSMQIIYSLRVPYESRIIKERDSIEKYNIA
jgi:hypothetical protein